MQGLLIQKYFVYIFIILGRGRSICINTAITSDSKDRLNLFNQNDLNNDELTTKVKAEALPAILNVTQYPGEQCQRVCQDNDKRVCYFHFVLEHYQAMGVACGECGQGVEKDCNNLHCIVGDGVEKGVMSINRQIPGPAIQVCHGDYIVVDVTNNAGGTAASLHWHGLHMKKTPFMDGVPYVTQCPISFANTFRYEFYASESGTQFYHSHAGHHKINGQYGALIVRQSLRADPMNLLYDYDLPEHVILVSDWMHEYAEQYFPGVPSYRGIAPDAILINGRGQFEHANRRQVIPTIFYVKPNARYRFRFINSVSHACVFKMQIRNHTFDIIASDSHNVRPRNYDTLVSNSGERYDFVLYTNHSGGDFWIRLQPLNHPRSPTIESFALLRYVTDDHISDQNRPDFPNTQTEWPEHKILNHPDALCLDESKQQCITKLVAVDSDGDALRFGTPDYKFFLAFQNYPMSSSEIFQSNKYYHFMNLYGNITLVGSINNISLILPDSPPLTQPKDMDEAQYCDSNRRPQTCESNQRLCPCVHRLQVKRNSLVEMIVVDETEGKRFPNYNHFHIVPSAMHHPFHLHGHRFMVAGLGRYPQIPMDLRKVQKLESEGLLPRIPLYDDPPYKDTLSIPNRGYAILRFRASNPGFWILHCPYEWHLAVGMGLILQVGTVPQMVKAPEHFPRCGNYVPRVKKPTFL